jgi:hypothetical protein
MRIETVSPDGTATRGCPREAYLRDARVLVKGLRPDLQGDRAIVEILRVMGADISETDRRRDHRLAMSLMVAGVSAAGP